MQINFRFYEPNILYSMVYRVCHYKNLQINPIYGQALQLSGKILW